MENDDVFQALTDQVSCYRRLAKLAAVQHDHIQHGRTQELLDVLQNRQEVLNQLQSHERTIAPAKAQWGQYVASLAPELRKNAEKLLAETKALLEQITSADKNDVMVLQQRKLNIGKRIQQTTTAQQVNRNYALAAYGSSRSKMDLRR